MGVMKRRTVKAGSREFLVVIERGEDGYYVGSVPDIHGCHSQGKTLDELLKNMKEAIALCLEVAGEEGIEPAQFVGVQKIKV